MRLCPNTVLRCTPPIISERGAAAITFGPSSFCWPTLWPVPEYTDIEKRTGNWREYSFAQIAVLYHIQLITACQNLELNYCYG